MDKRHFPRKMLDPIHVAEMKMVDGSTVLVHSGRILNASATGLLVRVPRTALHSDLEQNTAALAAFQGEYVVMRIVEMALDLEGMIVRTHQDGPEWVDIAIDLSASAPEFWRECLADLLPGLGEMHPETSADPGAGQAGPDDANPDGVWEDKQE